ncbi:MAG: response regulator transcription factor [Nostocoides sp.]
MIRVVVVDDQELVRAGFRLLLERVPDIEVVAEADDGASAVSAVSRRRPDVVLMDIRMPQVDGLTATRRLLALAPATRVIILTTFDADDYVYDALRAGASGFLLKSSPPERLITAIRTVAAGEALLDPAVTRRVIEAFTRQPALGGSPSPEVERLTEREREVLAQIARGRSNAEIAVELFISDATVKTHVARMLAKLQLRDRVQAVVYAYENGLVSTGADDPRDGPTHSTPSRRGLGSA